MEKKLYKSNTDRKLDGVCAGFGRYLDLDVTIVRLAWVFITLGSCGTGILAYLICAMLIPRDPNGY